VQWVERALGVFKKLFTLLAAFNVHGYAFSVQKNLFVALPYCIMSFDRSIWMMTNLTRGTGNQNVAADEFNDENREFVPA
jgi:hypothetical protein